MDLSDKGNIVIDLIVAKKNFFWKFLNYKQIYELAYEHPVLIKLVNPVKLLQAQNNTKLKKMENFSKNELKKNWTKNYGKSVKITSLIAINYYSVF